MNAEQSWERRWLQLSGPAITAQREYLNELDHQIGDSDHGQNLNRGFGAVMELLESSDAANISGRAAMVLLETVGGASGPLYAAAWQQIGKEVSTITSQGRTMQAPDAAIILHSATLGVQRRGHAEEGDKTMVDAWIGATNAARIAAADGAGLVGTWEAAARGAQVGANNTIPLQARRGRASYLGERSRGHLDPGAASTALLLECAAQAARETWGEENRD